MIWSIKEENKYFRRLYDDYIKYKHADTREEKLKYLHKVVYEHDIKMLEKEYLRLLNEESEVS